MPTDTVYGLAADAFNAEAVAGLLAAKGRDRTMPPPVLVSGRDVLKALTTRVGADVEALADAFWPGGLTIICWAQPSLAWDLGETAGTVAVRMPDHPVALGLLRSCGPLAVSSANLSGRAAALTAGQARDQLGDRVQVYLDDGETEGTLPSSIIDATGGVPALVRAGAIGYYRLSQVLPDLIDRTDHPTTPPTDDPTDPTDPTDDPGDDAATASTTQNRRCSSSMSKTRQPEWGNSNRPSEPATTTYHPKRGCADQPSRHPARGVAAGPHRPDGLSS
jgi:tRNA threonylcarbamoyl adenosine modification protein (Sua5/YciO/YrdC/YwlC family)